MVILLILWMLPSEKLDLKGWFTQYWKFCHLIKFIHHCSILHYFLETQKHKAKYFMRISWTYNVNNSC